MSRYRVECRSMFFEGHPRIRDAVIVDAVDAVNAAHIGSIDIALQYREQNYRWIVEAVNPLD